MVHQRRLKIISLKEISKLQWFQDQCEINGDNLNSVTHEASQHFRNKKMKYLKDKKNELITNSKTRNIRDLY
jgi:hypothetical protein